MNSKSATLFLKFIFLMLIDLSAPNPKINITQIDDFLGYASPDVVVVEPLHRAGIRMFIPDEEGMKKVTFHIKVNQKFHGIESGTISQIITKSKNGRWTIEDHTLKLNINDVVYFLIFCNFIKGDNHENGVIIRGQHIVTDFTYVEPVILVEPFSPVGLRLSIPDEKGISLVSFYIKFNQDFNSLEDATIVRDIIKPKNGRWVYEDKTTRLKENDIIYYRIDVLHKKINYNWVRHMHRVKVFYDYNGQIISKTQNTDQDIYYNAEQKDKDEIDDVLEISSKNKPFLETCMSDNSLTNEDNVSNSNKCYLSLTELNVPKNCNKNLCKGQLIFEDIFEDSRQLRKNWVIEERFSDAPDYEFVAYRDDIRNIYAKEGLKIVPKLLEEDYGLGYVKKGHLILDYCTQKQGSFDCYRKSNGWNILPPVTSGRINSKAFLQFRYGRVEIKAKFPQGDWIYPLLMLEPAEHNDENSIVQIRIASANGNRVLKTDYGKDISGHILWGGTTGNDSMELKDRTSDYASTKFNEELWSASYHVYEIIWSPNSIEFRVDGKTYGEQKVKVPGSSPYYLTLGVAVGGIYEYPDACVSESYSSYIKPWRNSGVKGVLNFYDQTQIWHTTWSNPESWLHVDYVKFWAL